MTVQPGLSTPVDDGLPGGEEGALARWVLRVCPPPHAPLLAMIQRVGSGLLPTVAGGTTLDLRRPSSIFATRLGGAGVVGWRPDILDDRFAPDRLIPLGDDPAAGRSVTFDRGEGLVRVDLAAFPADGRWHFFGLADRDLWEATDEEREIFALCRDHDAGPVPEPARLLLDGRLAEAWAAACAAGWPDDSLRGLLLLIFPAMDRLIAEACSVGLRGDAFDPLRRVLRDASRRVAALQQSLIEGRPA